MAWTVTWQTSIVRHCPLFVLLGILPVGQVGLAQGALATEMVKRPLPKALAVVASKAEPVYGPEERMIQYVGGVPTFLVTLDGGVKPSKIVPMDGMSIFWPAMVKALRDDVFAAEYAGRQVLVTVEKPHDPEDDAPVLVLHHHEDQEVPTEQRVLKRQLPCDTRMSGTDLLRQAHRLGAFPVDERRCYQLAVEKNPRSVAALWGAIASAPQHGARMDWYDMLLRLRPDFYEAQLMHWQDQRSMGLAEPVTKWSVPDEGAPAGIRVAVLEELDGDARKDGRFADELSLRDQLAGLRLEQFAMNPYKPGRYRVAMELFALGLRLDGAKKTADAVAVMKAALALAKEDRAFFGEYEVFRLETGLGHALGACGEASADSVGQKEIESRAVGDRGVLEARKMLFCGQAEEGMKRLEKEAAGHARAAEIHRVRADYAAATGEWVVAEKEEGLWVARAAAGEK